MKEEEEVEGEVVAETEVSQDEVVSEEETTTDEVVSEEETTETESTEEVVAEDEEKIEYSVEDDINALVEGEELSEEFKEKAATIFEAAINSKIRQEQSLKQQSSLNLLMLKRAFKLNTKSNSLKKLLLSIPK